MTGPRALLAAAVLSTSAAVVAGCGARPPATATSAGARRALESKVLDVMDGSGLPVQDDYIGCVADRDGRSDTCYGLTSDEPVEMIKGTFRAAPTGGPPGPGCPGTLSVTVGPPSADLTTNTPVHRLAARREDPCR
ncbi:MAG TPA: hypothetical protein VFN68_14230 [Acidimicrobiales bacterium]|nr:hypothetical protein [Acidimicrobiales bacterium]